eukprot:TRINITY_DN7764_c4_g1_i1.p1 TRINITY_DN7764_c4_g1~~TRINITY_DN7764_c4_g1_i1.p1  ORF type:complete len:233 (+),score=42.00 TRINITY_DN7764_c4_g1_i1:125-823(+)
MYGRPATAEPPGTSRSVTPGGRPGTALPPVKWKRLTSEEDLEKNLDRLYRAPVEKRRKKLEADEKEIAENRDRNTKVRKHRGNKDGELCQRVADKLFYGAVRRRVDAAKRLEQKYDQGLSWKARRLHQTKMEDRDIDDMVERLFRHSIDQKKRSLEQADKKFYPFKEDAKLSQKRQSAAVLRLSDEAVRRRHDAVTKAEAQYLFVPRQCKKVVVSKPEVVEYYRSLASPKAQ